MKNLFLVRLRPRLRTEHVINEATANIRNSPKTIRLNDVSTLTRMLVSGEYKRNCMNFRHKSVMEGGGFNVFIPVSLFLSGKHIIYRKPYKLICNVISIYLVLFNNGLTCRGMNNTNLRRLEGGQV